MFRKLVSNLPFQPALLGEVVFYLHRVRQEEQLRRLGLVLTAFVVLLQFFAIISPSRPSLATSAADIVYGATSRQDVLQAYKNNRDQIGHKDIQAIFNYYGIGADQIANASLTTIKDSDGKNYINTSRSATQFPDTFVKIPGASEGGLYEFPLSNWRKGEYPNGYPALTGISTNGLRFWILLKGCGNIVYEKGAKKPDIEIIKKRTSGQQVAPGDTVTYTIQFRNQGLGDAKSVSIVDRLPAELAYQSYTSSTGLTISKSGQQLTWKLNNTGSILAPSTKWHTITITTKAAQIQAANQLVCNNSSLSATGISTISSTNSESERCVTIAKAVCPGTGTPIPAGGASQCPIMCPSGTTVSYNQTCPVAQLTCQSLKTVAEPAWNQRKFETTILMQQGSVAKNVSYYVNDRLVSVQPVSANSSTQYYSYTFATAGKYKIRAEVTATTGNVQSSQNCALTENVEKPTTPVARISTDKSVANLTQKIADANNTTAHAGDVLRYTLTIANSGDAPANNFALNGEYGESIADVMEYATLTDKGDAFYNETTQFLTWAPTTIPAGGKIEKTFTVTVKNPIPATPISASNPLSFDYAMHNKYGRDVVVNLDKPVSKVIEQTATTLPNTGPGTTMFISALVVMIIGFFFYRSRLLSSELEVIQREYSAGGM